MVGDWIERQDVNKSWLLLGQVSTLVFSSFKKEVTTDRWCIEWVLNWQENEN